MKVKMTNQRYTYEKNTEEWTTTYITDEPMKTETALAYEKIDAFCQQHLAKTNEKYPQKVRHLTIERNGMLGLWQFTVVSSYEIAKFDIDESEDRADE